MRSAARVAAGQTALRDGRWQDARTEFEAALADEESADALEGLADACWWLCDAPASLRHRERAWVMFRESGDAQRAGQAALDLSIGYLTNLGNAAAARGWLGRAERISRTIDPNPLQGWLWLMHGYTSTDPGRAVELLTRGLEFAHGSGDVDLELVALSDLGLAKVGQGRLDEGMALLDEAMAGALAGEYRRLSTVVFASCSMLAACHLAGDLDRANQWCRVADEFMNRYGSPFLYARCRVHYGGVLLATGRWADAEDQLQAALSMSADAGPGPRMEALTSLADLRLRQGRLEEAEALLALVEDGSASIAAAALRLARGEHAIAAELLERRANRLGEHHIEVVATLAMLVEALLGDGDLAAARAAASRLSTAATAQDRGPAQALAVLATARIAAAESRTQEAINDLERALHGLAGFDRPLESAHVRLELARLLAVDRPALAIAEAQQALAAFDQLGAAADANATAEVLRSLGAKARSAVRGGDVLTGREREVLDLVAVGLSNPEIAKRLYISRKTAAHHVSNILAKLGLRNRGELVAFAVRQPSR